jgi:glutaredoxin
MSDLGSRERDFVAQLEERGAKVWRSPNGMSVDLQNVEKHNDLVESLSLLKENRDLPVVILNVKSTGVTDDVLRFLKELCNLRYLIHDETKITSVGLDKYGLGTKSIESHSKIVWNEIIDRFPIHEGKKDVKKKLVATLERAVSLLWKRTYDIPAVTSCVSGSVTKMTHVEALLFLERHPCVIECIEHIRDEAKGGALSTLRLSPGNCSALMYLMAMSDSEARIATVGEVPDEACLIMSCWDKAKDFWTKLCSVKDEDEGEGRGDNPDFCRPFDEIRKVNEGLQIEKHAIIVKAWNAFKTGDMTSWLTERPVCGGIDIGEAM